MIQYLYDFDWLALLYTICVNLFSSFIFIFALLYFLKPKIEIVPFIARQDNPFDDTAETCYAFKIINQSFFGAYEIEAKANDYSIRQGEHGIINKIFHKIELKTHRVNYIKRRRLFDMKYGDNCVQFFTYEDLRGEIIRNKKYIQFQVTARHSLTGLSNIFTYEFIDNAYVKDGFFVSGNRKEIKNC